MQKYNNWGVPYSVITFFEKVLTGHSKVRSFTRTKDILFTIKKYQGQTLIVLLLNEYCVSLAAALQGLGEFPEADYIVTGGSWNGYTEEAKQYCLQNNIGLFNLEEFLGALNFENPKLYCKKDKDGNPTFPIKSA